MRCRLLLRTPLLCLLLTVAGLALPVPWPLAALRSLMLFVVHQDLGNVELRDRSHASRSLLIHMPFELPRIIKHVEETQDDPSPDLFLNALEAQFAP